MKTYILMVLMMLTLWIAVFGLASSLRNLVIRVTLLEQREQARGR